MVVGIPKEVKAHEYRVAATPAGVRELASEGHRVIVEKSAGAGSGFEDTEYFEAGAEIVDKTALFKESELIIKVKEPVASEYPLLKPGGAIFTYLHLAPNPELTNALLEKKIAALGYETLEDEGGLPLLAPMSEIAGRMSPMMAAYFLQKPKGGSGVLPSGATGVPPANATVLGAGVVGTNAARIAFAMGMRVTVINRGIERLRALDEMFGGKIITLPATETHIRQSVKESDIVIGAVLVRGAKAPVLVSAGTISGMRKGSVVVDVSIDQGGCFETSRPTTHDEPVYEAHGVIHYCVTNMPGAYPRTSTMALTNRTLPYIKRLASMGIERAVSEDPALKSSLNVRDGQIVHEGLRRI